MKMNNRINIWIITAQENPSSVLNTRYKRLWRSNELARQLANRGHIVTRWRSSFNHHAKKQSNYNKTYLKKDGYNLQYIRTTSYYNHIGFKRVLSHYFLAKNFLKMIKQDYPIPPNLIFVSNVPIELCHAAVRYANKNNIPVVVDVRDLWPDIYADLLPGFFKIIVKPLQYILSKYSGKLNVSLSNATAITGLTKSYLNWGLSKAKRKKIKYDRVFPFCYPKSINISSKLIRHIYNKLKITKKDIIALYTGNIGYQSDFNNIIYTAQMLEKKHPNLKFVISGSGPKLNYLKELSKKSSNIIFTGWLDDKEIKTLLHLSTFGLIPFYPKLNYLLNIPNKFSEYLAYGLVICCNLGGEMGSLVKKHNCGFIYNSEKPNDLQKKISRLINDSKEIKKISKNSKWLHNKSFDNESINAKFVSYLETFVKNFVKN